MKRYLLLAGYIEDEYYWKHPAGWEAYRGNFTNFNEALEYYKKLEIEGADRWGQIIDTTTMKAIDCEIFVSPLSILTAEDMKVDNGIWGLWERGFINIGEHNKLEKLDRDVLEPFLTAPTKDELLRLLELKS